MQKREVRMQDQVWRKTIEGRWKRTNLLIFDLIHRRNIDSEVDMKTMIYRILSEMGWIKRG